MRDTLALSRRGFLGLAAAAPLWPLATHAARLETLSGRAFGTTWRCDAPAGAGVERIGAEIERLFDAIDRQMSPWRGDSDLSRFNAGAAGWHAADEELVRVTRSALSLATESDGAFDPTVGPLVARWGFGPIEGAAVPDWRALSVDSGRIGKARTELTLDLCGIAKGRALDRAVALAAAAGVDDLLFDLGGELRALGRHPSGRDWRVAVQHPRAGRPAPALLRLAPGSAVATSGLTTQSYALAGRTYGHIIDPAARAPADSALLSVTVVADDAMSADGWATALFAAGTGAGLALARQRAVAALFLVDDGSGLRRHATGHIEALLT